jgi:hypothetical protein
MRIVQLKTIDASDLVLGILALERLSGITKDQLSDTAGVLFTQLEAIPIKSGGDTTISGNEFKRSVHDQYLMIAGGPGESVAFVVLSGKDRAGDEKGRAKIAVVNAAKTGWVTAAEWSGCTDTPEMIAGTIPYARLKEGTPVKKAGDTMDGILTTANCSDYPGPLRIPYPDYPTIGFSNFQGQLWAYKNLESGWETFFTFNADSEMVAGVIPSARLKTSTGSATGSGRNVDITMNDYCFFPAITRPYGNFGWITNNYASGATNTIGKFNIFNADYDAEYGIYWRYCTSSGNPEIWLGIDAEGKIVSVWEAEDPPPSTPPIESKEIANYIKINPDTKTLKAMREAGNGKLGQAIIDEAELEEDYFKFGKWGWEIEYGENEDYDASKSGAKQPNLITRIVNKAFRRR